MEKPFSNMSLRDLIRRCEETERALECREPTLFGRYRLLRQAIESFERTPDKPYASVKWPRDAILLCLERHGMWMTRRQIKRDLELGGFIFEPETFDNLLADALRYHASRGTLARRDQTGALIPPGNYTPGTRFRNEQYGLAAWVNDRSVGELQEI